VPPEDRPAAACGVRLEHAQLPVRHPDRRGRGRHAAFRKALARDLDRPERPAGDEPEERLPIGEPERVRDRGSAGAVELQPGRAENRACREVAQDDAQAPARCRSVGEPQPTTVLVLDEDEGTSARVDLEPGDARTAGRQATDPGGRPGTVAPRRGEEKLTAGHVCHARRAVRRKRERRVVHGSRDDRAVGRGRAGEDECRRENADEGEAHGRDVSWPPRAST
jgi:hypothetical protein